MERYQLNGGFRLRLLTIQIRRCDDDCDIIYCGGLSCDCFVPPKNKDILLSLPKNTIAAHFNVTPRVSAATREEWPLIVTSLWTIVAAAPFKITAQIDTQFERSTVISNGLRRNFCQFNHLRINIFLHKKLIDKNTRKSPINRRNIKLIIVKIMRTERNDRIRYACG